MIDERQLNHDYKKRWKQTQFWLRTSTREKLMLGLGLFDKSKNKLHSSAANSTIYSFTTIFVTNISTICPQGYYSSMYNSFSAYKIPRVISSISVLFVALQLAKVCTRSFIKIIQIYGASFVFCFGCRDCFDLKKFLPALQIDLQVESQTEISLFVNSLQKQAFHFTRISHRERSERSKVCFLPIWV